MIRNIWFVLVFVVLLATGCPVDKSGEAPAIKVKSSATSAKPVADATENPCGEAEAADENPCGDNPCMEENPCGENPCAADNPCGEENPCAAANPCADDANPCGEDTYMAEEPTASDDPNVTNVMLETTKGDIVIAVHHDWSPLGADHFIELVESGYYDGAPWFRVISGFMCQTGIAADPALTREWRTKTIQDEPVVQGNLRGNVSYGRSGLPNSRGTHFFINYKNNSSLDATGFPAFGQVVSGMEIADFLYVTGENPPNTQQMLTQQGAAFFTQQHPEGDFIVKATVQK